MRRHHVEILILLVYALNLALTVQCAYVSVYSAYQRLDSERYYPDATSRLIAGALQDGSFTQSFIGLNNQ